MTKEKKPRMRDLSINPENEMDIEIAVEKLKQKQYRAMLIRDRRNKEFSMIENGWKRLVFWAVGGTLLGLGIMLFVNAILVSAGFPSAIPW